ncbi:MAG: fucose isomerase [Caldilineae bacterium]|nr:MAG: fucose isomerase [Caldilineae bacterium]
MTDRVAFVPLARPTFDIPYARNMAETARAALSASGLDVLGPEDLVEDERRARALASELSTQPIELLVLFQATFADSTMAMALARAISVPVLLWAVPEPHTGGRLRLNSLCGINLAAHAFTRSGIRYHTLYAPPDSTAAVDKVHALAAAARVRRRLAQARVARVGDHPAGFDTCEPEAEALHEVFGARVVQVDLQAELFPAVRSLPSDAVDPLLDDLSGRLQGLSTLDARATRGTLSIYRVLQEMARDKVFDAYAIRCWPEFFTDLGCAACGAMSLLNDAMIPASCEADVNGALTELILQELSGEPVFGTDMVSLDAGLDAVVLWHCGKAPLSMADPDSPIATTIHSNRRLPLLMDFSLRPGRVTVARVSRATGEYRLVLGGGEIVAGPKPFSGTTGYLRFDRPAMEVLDIILAEGLEHHIALTYGDHRPALRVLADLLDLPVLDLTP